MDIIDICEKFSGRGCLKRYYESNNIFDYKIISMGLLLSIGDIKYNHLSYVKDLCDDYFYDYSYSINEVLKNAENNKIRIWSSKGDDDDYLMFLYLCDLLKDKCTSISVIFVTDFSKGILSINALSYKELDAFMENEIQLSSADIINYSDEWKDLVEVNSDLRVLENGTVKNKSFNQYDKNILDILDKLGTCKISDLIFNLMINYVINDACSFVYQYLVDRLIQQKKIKVVKKEKDHFYDTIELDKQEVEDVN